MWKVISIFQQECEREVESGSAKRAQRNEANETKHIFGIATSYWHIKIAVF